MAQIKTVLALSTCTSVHLHPPVSTIKHTFTHQNKLHFLFYYIYMSCLDSLLVGCKNLHVSDLSFQTLSGPYAAACPSPIDFFKRGYYVRNTGLYNTPKHNTSLILLPATNRYCQWVSVGLPGSTQVFHMKLH